MESIGSFIQNYSLVKKGFMHMVAGKSGRMFADDRLTLSALRLHGTARSSVIWNSLPGSVLHGVLGFTLKDTCCVRASRECRDCFAEQCPYRLLVEPPPPPDALRMRKYPRVPPPLRLTVLPWDAQDTAPGERIVVDLVLVGTAAAAANRVLFALSQAAATGIGRQPKGGKRGVIQWECVEDLVTGGTYAWADHRFDAALPFAPARWTDIADRSGPVAEIEFITPTRIVAHGRVQSRPALRDIVSTLLRRLSNLAYFHCGVELDSEFADLLRRTEQLTAPALVSRCSAQRYSSRQQRRITVDGITGSLRLPAGLEFCAPWFAVGQYLGLGKGTSMGLGSFVCR